MIRVSTFPSPRHVSCGQHLFCLHLPTPLLLFSRVIVFTLFTPGVPTVPSSLWRELETHLCGSASWLLDSPEEWFISGLTYSCSCRVGMPLCFCLSFQSSPLRKCCEKPAPNHRHPRNRWIGLRASTISAWIRFHLVGASWAFWVLVFWIALPYNIQNQQKPKPQ